MNLQSSFFIKTGAVIAMGALVAPMATFAAPRSEKNFCDNLASIQTRMQEKMIERSEKQREHWNDRDEKIEDRFSKRDTVRNDHRDGRDEYFAKKIASLKTRYPDADDQTAITAFETAIKNAITARRTAVDSAVTTFRTDMRKLVEDRQTDVDAVTATFKADVERALAQAKTSCTSGTDPVAVRATFKTALENAKATVKSSRTSLDKLHDEIKQLADARKALIEKAKTDFNTAVITARETLKTALGE